jgi:hypothetical protein
MLRTGLKTLTAILTLGLLAAANTIPAGTKLTVRIDSQISSRSARTGEQFHASLARDLVVRGKTIAKTGAPVSGRVTYAKPSGRLHAPGELALRLTSVEVNGKMMPISTSAYRAKGKSHTKSNVTKIGGGTAAGAILGGVFGGGKGALIGAAAGGAAGTGLAAATGKQEAIVHAESVLSFSMMKSATVN